MSELFDKRLLLITGKGGVGKSTVGLALAQAAAARGKTTLFVSTAGRNLAGPIYGIPGEMGYEARELEPGLKAMELDPKHALHEYVVRQIKFEFLYQKVFENRVVRYFLEALPGLKDLLLVGKMIDLAGNKRGNPFDLVIVDLPATGHGLHMLRIPFHVKAMVQTGPLHKNAERMDEFLHDREKTGICLVTLPEEMPVNEALDMHRILEKEMDLAVDLVAVNGLYPKVFRHEELAEWRQSADKPFLRTLLDCAESEDRRLTSQEAQCARLVDGIRDCPVWPLPFIFARSFGRSSVRALRDEWLKRLD